MPVFNRLPSSCPSRLHAVDLRPTSASLSPEGFPFDRRNPQGRLIARADPTGRSQAIGGPQHIRGRPGRLDHQMNILVKRGALDGCPAVSLIESLFHFFRSRIFPVLSCHHRPPNGIGPISLASGLRGEHPKCPQETRARPARGNLIGRPVLRAVSGRLFRGRGRGAGSRSSERATPHFFAPNLSQSAPSGPRCEHRNWLVVSKSRRRHQPCSEPPRGGDISMREAKVCFLASRDARAIATSDEDLCAMFWSREFMRYAAWRSGGSGRWNRRRDH